ncbi:magnesium transporter [Mediterraneibacter glycyrrhizinilyticus]|jgi:magnesium transporter|uniref:Magnesium transporter MgtE n=1 Tax=Candidatus Mediterraneibacter faecipullorum TaxID=2838670 RepID=A0A9D2NLP4_9FIRM|nr:magnesium transporter [Mediterraneibacter glycyrrhizinilyticus]MBM6803144.1 magnesium transporter [Mediterraneibacter glycyrrhizinilyticus]MDM8125773.1 magnesium transporter [Mediterraneibacter glycyrrhizinilyticus]MDM8210627.1 magnesium transporter [Mediterraneibacter glycyrrhizinilyticus]HJC33470.1 magnesium transporter [Candidatus Mediterraneibacter faecipullorum]
MNKDIFVKLLQQRQYKAVRSILDVMNEVDIASLLSELDDKELALAFRLIPKDKAAEVFANMESSMQTYLVEMFSEKELKELLDDLYMDDTVDLLEELPANLVNRILDTVSTSDRALINQLLNYPEDSAGSIMTTEYVDIRENMTVAQSMAHIKETGIHKETIYTCYVTERRRLTGIVSAKDLMTTDDDVLIRDLMETEIISVKTHTDKEEVAKLFTKYDFLAIPVLDTDGLMVGIVTFDDAMDVMVEEATEDITKMAAINPSEKTYFETSVFAHARNRIPWLLILMFTSIITGTIITKYENAFAAIPLLVSFIPMLMDTGGNCGSQSSTLIIRGLALSQIRFKDIFRVIFKEFRISLIVGAVLALTNGVRIMIQYNDAGLALVIALSLIGTVVISKMVGCMLPLLASKIHLDPAIMASPLITTLVDIFSILIYFNVATMLFNL